MTLLLDFVSYYLVIAVLIGAAINVMLVFIATGATALREKYVTAISDRVTALNRGNPISVTQRAKASLQHFVIGLFDTRSLLRDSDVMWAASMQKESKNVEAFDDRAELYVLLETLLPSTAALRAGVGNTAELRAINASARLIDGIGSAGDLGALREAARGYQRIRFALLRAALATDELTTIWRLLFVRLADSIGRGTAIGLLVGIVLSGGTGSLLDRVAVVSLVGGVLGTVFFNLDTLKRMRTQRQTQVAQKVNDVARWRWAIVIVGPAVPAAFMIGFDTLSRLLGGALDHF